LNPKGRVSVIIPARNEEANIARVVRSLAGQEGVREILVVDDQSDDRTSDILRGLQAEVPALRSLRIESLPEGWLGKSYALATGAREASGEWLLFTDADTEHLKGSLAALLETAEQRGANLLSLSPGQETPTWWEKSVIPLVYVKLAELYRFEEVSDPNSPAAAANGQYLLVRRDMYQRVGGHEAVRGTILEDVELARRVKAAGGRLMFLPGAAWVRTRMYGTFGEMWRGWRKNLYLLYGGDLKRIFSGFADAWIFDILPAPAFIVLCLWLVAEPSGMAVALGAVACFLLAALREWSYARALQRLGFDVRLAGYLVPGALLFSLMLVNSASAHRLSGHVEWKGRKYSTKGKP
jgi:glycosyltransferase involved in cell wall biosynthesis